MNIDDAKLLVNLARNSIESTFFGHEIFLHDTNKFSENKGVFVKLNKYEKLRGCVGFPEANYTLQRGIIEASRCAAFKDHRFSKITKDEFE